MSETPPRPEAEGAPAEPFTRGRIQWSRPPQTVFRIGPLPEAPAAPLTAPRLTGMPTGRPGGGVLTGSMIPTARPVAPEAAPAETVVTEMAAPEPEPEPQPEPEPEPAPEPQPVRPVEQIVEIEPAEWVETVPPLAGEVPPAEPRSLPSVVVTPTLYATVSAAVQTVKPKDRWIWIAAFAAMAITAGFVWLATLPGGGSAPLDLDAPPPAASSPAT
ncbi:MAG: hypothetical protein Q8S03_09470 [Brevundimonas sp.]|uniref:hypothetical protein n=1 Tax=Brevundimonas sp. TaxID=1871086 RepID=UPI002734BE43|nr:hypothetical protein [Brevundimonas sp.]MDP3404908.1 hypothetical protein [Brevundimonas sp.]